MDNFVNGSWPVDVVGTLDVVAVEDGRSLGGGYSIKTGKWEENGVVRIADRRGSLDKRRLATGDIG